VWDGPGAEIKIYLNGVLAESAATTMDLSAILRENAYIGDSCYTGDAYMTGTVDEFRIYSAALTDAEILDSFNAGPDAEIPTGPAEAAPTIIYVTNEKDLNVDGVQDNLAWLDWLEAEGYTIDFRPSNWVEPLDPNKVAELEAADLIIASRGMSTGDYDADATTWNSLTTPIICTNAWMIRSNRWVWMNSTSANKDAGAPYLLALDTAHPVFENVPLDADGLVEILDPTVGSGHTSFLNDILDVGNGTLIAQSLGIYNTAWIAEWPIGVEYYDGAGQVTGGARLLLMAGTQDDPYTDENGNIMPVDELNLNDAGKQLFLNAIEYMLSLERPEVPSSEGPSTEGLLAYYALEEDVLDSSGNGFDGTIVGDPVYTEGAIGMAMDFNGDDYIDCGNDESFSVTEYLTVALWVNIRTIPTAWTGAITKGNTAWRISNNNVSTGMHFGFEDGSRGWQAANSATELNIGEWYHVCGVYDINVGAKIYINGLEDGSNADTGGITQNTSIVAIGTNSDSTYPEQAWDGLLDEVLIYNRALSADEVAALAGM
jgi:hypothetical protein